MRKVKCVVPRDKLIKDRLYTITEELEDHGSHFISVKEINNGHNSFFDWRFLKMPYNISKNIQIL
jgi:hypothetical protein